MEKLRKNAKLLVFGLMLMTFGCQQQEQTEPITEQDVDAKIDYCAKQCENCVYKTRCYLPKLPFGLEFYSAKKALINSYEPKAGTAAIMPSPNLPKNGHIAPVTSVSKNSKGETIITIEEGNSVSKKCTTRSGTPKSFGVVGYWDPNKK